MNQIGVSRDRLKASVGHIWPMGRMLCMPALGSCQPTKLIESL